MSRKIVSEITYNVSHGTLNPTIPYHTMQSQWKFDYMSMFCIVIQPFIMHILRF